MGHLCDYSQMQCTKCISGFSFKREEASRFYRTSLCLPKFLSSVSGQAHLSLYDEITLRMLARFLP